MRSSGQSPAPDRSARARGLPPHERRKSLVDAGWDLLVAGGPRAVQIEAVVERLGITRPIFYRHFPDRIGLLVAIYERYADALIAVDEATIATFEGETTDDCTRVGVHRYFDMVADQGVLIRPLVETARHDPRMKEAQARLLRRQIRTWTPMLSELADPRLWELVEHDPDLGGEVMATIQLTQAMYAEAAELWLSGAVSRQQAEGALLVLILGCDTRLAAAAGLPPTPTGAAPRPTAAAKATAKKAPVKKAPVKKAPVKKAPVKKAPVKKGTASRARDGRS